jgi:tryptophan synthase beta chain
MHANLYTSGRGRFMSATDEEAMKWAFEISRLEGIIPALETAHAFAVLEELELSINDITVICLSGRGDKDLATYMTAMENQ